MSGDGCVVAYSVPAATPNAVQLVDGQSLLDGPSGLAQRRRSRSAGCQSERRRCRAPTPALSFDGRVIAWSTGTTVLRYVEAGQRLLRCADTIVVATARFP